MYVIEAQYTRMKWNSVLFGLETAVRREFQAKFMHEQLKAVFVVKLGILTMSEIEECGEKAC